MFASFFKNAITEISKGSSAPGVNIVKIHGFKEATETGTNGFEAGGIATLDTLETEAIATNAAAAYAVLNQMQHDFNRLPAAVRSSNEQVTQASEDFSNKVRKHFGL